MSVNATLTAPGGEYRVIKVDYEFNQPVDNNCRPIALPRGGFINFVVEARRNTGILNWMLGADKQSDGEVIIEDERKNKLRSIKFSQGKCVYYKEEYDTFDQDQMKMHFRIATQRIEINGEEHQQVTWTGSGSNLSNIVGGPASEVISSFNPMT